MQINFEKYHGAGNDFILIDNRHKKLIFYSKQVVKLCDRHLGIGADGLMLLESSKDNDFRMQYYNSDGSEGMLCGNGGRCIVAYAKRLGIIQKHAIFEAADGIHEAVVDDNFEVTLQMADVEKYKIGDDFDYINTGAPHHINYVEDVDVLDVNSEGRKIRYSPDFEKEGTNVNFISVKENQLIIRTYERGVEAETLSCGTGIVASVISAFIRSGYKYKEFVVKARGGNLRVFLEKAEDSDGIEHIWLRGPTQHVFSGTIELSPNL